MGAGELALKANRGVLGAELDLNDGVDNGTNSLCGRFAGSRGLDGTGPTGDGGCLAAGGEICCWTEDLVNGRLGIGVDTGNWGPAFPAGADGGDAFGAGAIGPWGGCASSSSPVLAPRRVVTPATSTGCAAAASVADLRAGSLRTT